jgi:hypothetical protein
MRMHVHSHKGCACTRMKHEDAPQSVHISRYLAYPARDSLLPRPPRRVYRYLYVCICVYLSSSKGCFKLP